MANYIKFKSRRFVLEKDAKDWAKKEKKDYEGTKFVKIDINYVNTGQYEAALFMRMDD